MDINSQRKVAAILRILDDAGAPLGSTKIARELHAAGVDLKQRMVRNYLEEMDETGLTVNLGRRGRQITPVGQKELASAVVIDKVGFIASRVDGLAFAMSLDVASQSGTLILNISTFDKNKLPDARAIASEVMRAGLGMGRYMAIAGPGRRLGSFRVPAGQAAIGTVCSITMNGVFRLAGIPITSRFGGLLEFRDGRPVRFTHIINYDGTTLDPLEIFIKAGMTSVREVVRTGNGLIGASFREIPAAALPKARRLIKKLEAVGLEGMTEMGDPHRPLLEIPVPHGRLGIVVAGGMNPLAAVHEAGIETHNQAMARLCNFTELTPVPGKDAE
ncbi:MAG TPA: NrpR regulatory domain-containing protein [Candidatus Brocadiia bacterium]|nr:NrpR regulatory domain-containing protein [Candidatus Brocadiia bacterium]